ncbi:putative reverse transcriptase domain, exostosin [Helianthus annuus]|nr:putative reverse transcriptase domain, exostosin [Helianthus annuus]
MDSSSTITSLYLACIYAGNRQDKRSGNRKNGQCLSIQRALSQWGDHEGFGILIQSLFAQPVKEGPEGFKKMSNKKSEDGSSNVKQCLRKVADGHFTAAVKVLCSSGVAPLDKKTMKALVDKHPCMPPPTMPAFLPSEPHLVAETDSVLGCIKSFPKGTSCGRDGLRAQHLLDALCGEGSVIAVSLLRAISAVVNLFLRGGCPRSLAEFIASAPLTPLLKPDNGIRPIAVGSIWRRVVSKVAMKGVGKDMAKYLGDFQFGVGVPNGAEAVLHSANRLLNTHHQDGSLAMLTVDFSNAFNLVDRTALLNEVRKMCPSISAWVDFLYGQPARLYVGNNNIWSSTGVQQGDPLGPLLFALVLHPLVLRIRDRCKLLFHAWYLDDGTLIGDATQVAKALDIIRVEGPSLGLLLNIKKTEVFWPTCDGVKTQEGLFPREIGRPVHGVKLLGGAVSRDEEFISGLALKRAKCAVELMGCLKRLRDPQSELLLLRSCMGVAKLLFGLRTCQPSFVGEVVSVFDKGLRNAIENIVVCGGAFFGDLQWRLASLPTRFGGLGICSAEDASSYAFVASRAQSWVLQDHILRECGGGLLDSDYTGALDNLHSSLPDLDLGGFYIKDTAPIKAQKILANALYGEIVKTVEEKFALSPRQRAVFECLRAPHAQDFLSVVPIEGLGQCMSAVEYRAILKYRLMVPLFPVDDPCPVCRKSCLDTFGEHAIHCKELPGFKYRHDLVRDVLYDVLKRAGISAKKEAPVNFLTDPLEGRSTLRPADILVFGWEGGKHACVDLTGVSPLVGLKDHGFVAGQAITKAEAAKVAKHEKACIENQHVFTPFAFDTFGALAPDAVRFLKRVQQVVSSNTAHVKGQNFVFSRVGFAIQKGVAAQLVARLPAISL